jgi:hypothetical protein
MRNSILLACILAVYGCSTDLKPKQNLNSLPQSNKGKVSNASTKENSSKDNSPETDSALFLKEFKMKDINTATIIRDTLKIVSVNGFFYYPLGKFHDSTALKNSLKSLNFKKEYVPDETSTSGKTLLYRFYNANSFVKYFYQPDTEEYEIVSGKITDQSLVLLNGTKIGMDKNDFFDLYFTKAVHNTARKINVVEFISGLEGIWHYYTFKDDKLAGIYFDTDYQLDKK